MEGVTTKNDVLVKARELDVQIVHLQFTDLTGNMKNISVTIEQLEKALDNEIMFDGSSIDGFARIEESDMFLFPDVNTFQVFPWRPKQGVEARLICDVHTSDGKPFSGCPRNILKKAISEAAEYGYTLNVGAECEFYLFKLDEKGARTLNTNDEAGYFDMAPIDTGENARRDMVMTLKQMGYEIEASHHECGSGQHEIDFKYADALTTADNIMTFKLVVKVIAKQHNLHATFMPKPIYGVAGSGMHLNQSLFKNGKNVFDDPQGTDGLSETAYQYIAGLLRHAKGLAAFTNPTVNSYKRLVPEFEAPVYIAWSHKNRSPLIRIPAKRGVSARIELRNPDPSANPYLALCASLYAGLDGIRSKMTPPDAAPFNLYSIDAKALGIEKLPETLKEALEELKKDDLLMGAVGEHAKRQYISGKEKEWETYRTQVTEWEIQTYLNNI